MIWRFLAWATRCGCRDKPYLEHRTRTLHYTVAHCGDDTCTEDHG